MNWLVFSSSFSVLFPSSLPPSPGFFLPLSVPSLLLSPVFSLPFSPPLFPPYLPLLSSFLLPAPSRSFPLTLVLPSFAVPSSPLPLSSPSASLFYFPSSYSTFFCPPYPIPVFLLLFLSSSLSSSLPAPPQLILILETHLFSLFLSHFMGIMWLALQHPVRNKARRGCFEWKIESRTS